MRGKTATDTYCKPFTIPASVPRGLVLCHNQYPHGKRTASGVGGFRAWFTCRVPKDFENCPCGWAGLRHKAHVSAIESPPIAMQTS